MDDVLNDVSQREFEQALSEKFPKLHRGVQSITVRKPYPSSRETRERFSDHYFDPETELEVGYYIPMMKSGVILESKRRWGKALFDQLETHPYPMYPVQNVESDSQH